MDSFGEYLKRERELRGVTLEEISQATNIGKTYLKALENDDYDVLPAEVFIKGFLRSYAENTGMDTNEVLLAYDEFISKKRDVLQDSDASGIAIEATNKMTVPTFILLSILTLIVFSSFLFYYFGKHKENKPRSGIENQIAQGREEAKNSTDIDGNVKTLLKAEPEAIKALFIANKPSPDETIPDKNVPAAPSEKILPTLETSAEDILTLTLIAIEDAWISLSIDDNENKEFIITTGRTVQWEAKDKFVVTLGNTAGTRLKLNGIELFLPQPRSNILRDYAISLDNINPQ